jgi:predicted Zn-dependent protease
MIEQNGRTLAQNERDNSVRRLRDCVKAAPDDQWARLELGEALYRQGKFIQARVELDRILHAAPENHQARLYLGLTMCKMGNPDKVKTAWKGYFEPGNLELQREINVQLAFLETENDLDLDEIAACVERAAGLRPMREEA